ncbi:MAG: hypothetical protein KGO96_13050 [Elusimicrobia bacterium]|nr:hypothetical protein [Elusimicrobiota bacterium]
MRVVAILAVLAAVLAIGSAAYIIQVNPPSTPTQILLPQPETLNFAPLSSSLGSASFSMIELQGSTLTLSNGDGQQVAKVQGSGTPLTITISKGSQQVALPGSIEVPTGGVLITYFGPFTVTTAAATAQFHSGSLGILLDANGTVSSSYQVS